MHLEISQRRQGYTIAYFVFSNIENVELFIIKLTTDFKML